MRWLRYRHSLWFRLIWRTGVILVGMAMVAVVTMKMDSNDIVGRLVESTLALQSAQLLPYVIADDDTQAPRIPDVIRDAYTTSSETLIFALIDEENRILWASSESARTLLTRRPRTRPTPNPTVFRLSTTSGPPTTYTIMVQAVPDGRGTRLLVGRGVPNSQARIIALRRIAADNIEWLLLAMLAAPLLAAIWALRDSIKPLRRLGEHADAMVPGSASPSLVQANMPLEIRHAVAAIDQAFDRISAAYEAHRTFTGTVAHELRSPLTMLSLQLEDLKDSASAAGLRHDVDRMRRLVDQLLAMVRADSLPVAIPEDIDLGALARDVVATMAPSAAMAGVRLGFSAPTQPVPISGESLSLWLAIRNLIENAITHTPAGTEVAVTVAADGSLSVRDHGEGIPPEDRTRVFERFWRRANTPDGGTGLGLAIVAGAASQHGGSVAIADAVGGGALVTLRLPLRNSPAA